MKFSKIYLLPLILLLIFVLAACGKKDDPDLGPEEVKKEGEVKEELLLTTAKELLNRAESLYCEAEYEFEEGIMKSVYYFDNENERMRMDSGATIKDGEIAYNMSFIIKDNWAYMWDDSMNINGLKMTVETREDIEQDQADLEKELEFNCRSWSVDDSVFILPADKSFPDMSDFLEQIQSMEMPSPDDYQPLSAEDFQAADFDPCSFCDMYPAGQLRDDCLDSC